MQPPIETHAVTTRTELNADCYTPRSKHSTAQLRYHRCRQCRAGLTVHRASDALSSAAIHTSHLPSTASATGTLAPSLCLSAALPSPSSSTYSFPPQPFTPPPSFARLLPRFYRCCSFGSVSHSYLASLQLRSCLYMSLDAVPPPSTLLFFQQHRVHLQLLCSPPPSYSAVLPTPSVAFPQPLSIVSCMSAVSGHYSSLAPPSLPELLKPAFETLPFTRSALPRCPDHFRHLRLSLTKNRPSHRPIAASSHWLCPPLRHRCRLVAITRPVAAVVASHPAHASQHCELVERCSSHVATDAAAAQLLTHHRIHHLVLAFRPPLHQPPVSAAAHHPAQHQR